MAIQTQVQRGCGWMRRSLQKFSACKVGVLALALLSAGLVHAQAWPTKAVRIVVPFSPGGTADFLARLVGEALQKNTGQPFVIDTKTGAGGTIGAGEVVRSAADGYTLLLATSSTHSVAPAVRKDLPYNTSTDFTPIALLAEANNLLLVSPSVGAKTLNELVALARQKPDALNYSTGGTGTQSHLAFEFLKVQAGIELTHVPYRGTGASINDIIGGTVQMTWDSLPTGLPHVKAGRLLGLAVSGTNRSPLAPDIPAAGEVIKGFSNTTWYGVYGPRGLSPELTLRINQEINKALQGADVVAKFQTSLGSAPGKSTPAEFAAVVAAERDRWTRLIRERGIKLD
jgi:tripartite-type tricarboxylate transporter receptor subunit TctC